MVDVRCVNEQIYEVIRYNVKDIAKRLKIEDEKVIEEAEKLAIQGLSKYTHNLRKLAGVALYYTAKEHGIKVRQKDICEILGITDANLRQIMKRVFDAKTKRNRENEILEILRNKEGITTKDLAEELKLCPHTIRWYIKKLRKKGVVETDGKGRIFLRGVVGAEVSEVRC